MGQRRLIEAIQKITISEKAWWSAACGLAVFCLGVEAWARAGGGQNYSGGGGDFGGGGGGGDGGDIAAMVIYLMIRYPQVGVPLAVVVVTVAAVKHLRNPDRTTARAVRRLENLPAAPQTSLAAIAGRDPNFDQAAFLARVQATEAKVQAAWTEGDMTPVRRLLSDGLTRRFSTQLLLMKNQNVRNVTVDHKILNTEIRGVASDKDFDTIHVAVEAEARDADVDATMSLVDAQAAAKKKKLETYVEIWSFLRKAGTATLKEDALLEGRCPNCGATLVSAQSTRCDHCKALVNSGQYDWVLTEITQAAEWTMGSTGKVRGLKTLEAADPGFNRQAAEDRASYLFWRWIEALASGNTAPLAKVASKSFKKRMETAVASGPGRFFKVAVGAVDLSACETNVEGMDRFHVKILWSTARSQKDNPAHQANVITVCRKSGALDASGFSYAHCPECHGPLSENDSATCEYCGAALDAGEKDWVLDGVIRPEELRLSPRPKDSAEGEPEYAGLVPDMGNPRERVLLLMRMAAVVMADGVVTKSEMKLLKSAAKRWNVPFDAVTPILEGAADLEEISGMKPSDPAGFFTGLVAAALVDGRIDNKEKRLLLNIAHNLEMDPAMAEKRMQEMAARQAA